MIDLLLPLAPFYVWRYNGAVQVVNFPPNENKVGASGECPHCAPTVSYFRPVSSYVHHLPNNFQKVVSATQCESCKGFVLVIGNRQSPNHHCQLESVYPLGKPNDTVATEVQQAAKSVAEDFAEALRCQWVKAYKACVVMCACAVQGSAIALGAKKKTLTDQIDELFS